MNIIINKYKKMVQNKAILAVIIVVLSLIAIFAIIAGLTLDGTLTKLITPKEKGLSPQLQAFNARLDKTEKAYRNLISPKIKSFPHKEGKLEINYYPVLKSFSIFVNVDSVEDFKKAKKAETPNFFRELGVDPCEINIIWSVPGYILKDFKSAEIINDDCPK